MTEKQRDEVRKALNDVRNVMDALNDLRCVMDEPAVRKALDPVQPAASDDRTQAAYVRGDSVKSDHHLRKAYDALRKVMDSGMENTIEHARKMLLNASIQRVMNDLRRIKDTDSGNR